MLVVGAGWLVDGAVAAASWLGVSELIIGLTVIAVGTSLPEIATSVIASLRGERDIAVGNVVGSNLFNILLVLGLTALVAPNGIAVAAAVLRFDMLVMVAASVACLPIFFTEHRIARWEGGLFFGYYLLYLLYLSLEATGHSAFVPFTIALLGFVLPLTVITLLVSLWRSWRKPSFD
jgi:cation:H+ antiporter